MRWFMMVAVFAVATLVVGFAAVSRAEEEPLKQEPVGKSGPAEEPSPADARIEDLVKRLGSDDYDAREMAYRELEGLGSAAKPALERAARSEDVQTRVSAARLLGKLEARSTPGARRERSPDRWPERGLEDWERRLRELGLPGFEGDVEEWRRQMEKRLEALRRNLDGLEEELEREIREGLKREPGSVERRVIMRTDEESIDGRVDAAGRVRVEITSVRDGVKESRVHEAESVEAFEKAHPEVWEKVKGLLGGGGRLRVEIGSPRWPGGADRTDPWRSPFPGADEGPRLGILVGEISAALRSHLGLAPEQGLLVEEVLPDTRAERLGLRRYDVLLEVNGASVGDAADVREALSRLEKDASARVTIVRRGKREELVETR